MHIVPTTDALHGEYLFIFSVLLSCYGFLRSIWNWIVDKNDWSSAAINSRYRDGCIHLRHVFVCCVYVVYNAYMYTIFAINCPNASHKVSSGLNPIAVVWRSDIAAMCARAQFTLWQRQEQQQQQQQEMNVYITSTRHLSMQFGRPMYHHNSHMYKQIALAAIT